LAQLGSGMSPAWKTAAHAIAAGMAALRSPWSRPLSRRHVADQDITGWLNRRGPKRCPFPEPRRSLYRLYWPVSVLQAWREDYVAGIGRGVAERVSA